MRLAPDCAGSKPINLLAVRPLSKPLHISIRVQAKEHRPGAGRWGEVVAGEAKVTPVSFVLHAQGQVTADCRSRRGFVAYPRHLLVVVVLAMGFGDALQLAATVVVIDGTAVSARCLRR